MKQYYRMMMGGLMRLVALGAMAFAFTAMSAFAAAVKPANDNRENAETLSGDKGEIQFSTTGATIEKGEPIQLSCEYATASVWFKWTAPANGVATFSTEGSEFNTVLGIYRLDSLSEVVFNDDGGENYRGLCDPGDMWGFSKCKFPAEEGQSYYVVVAGNGGNGSAVLSWECAEAGTPEFTIEDGVLTHVELNGAIEITIPDEVVEIGANYSNVFSYEDRSYVFSVVIPDTVTTINDWSFYDCRNLRDIVLPDGLMSIGYSAFSSCISLRNVVFPDSLMSIGNNAFYNCISLRNIILPDGLTSIGNSAFSYNTSLTNVTFGASLETIGNGSFYECEALKSVEFPASLKHIGDYAFSCSGLQPGCVTFKGNTADVEIAESAFLTTPYYIAQQEALKFELKIEDGVLVGFIGKCPSTFTIPAEVKSIGDSAFGDYENQPSITNLTKVIIPASVTNIEAYAFKGCSSLATVTLNKGLERIGYEAFAHSAVKSITIPSSVKEIEEDAFWFCAKLASVTLNEGLEYIGWGAFASSAVKSIAIPSSVKVIDGYAFGGCTNLATITLKEGLEYIGYDAFAVSAVKSIIIPSSVKEIDECAFGWCSKLTSVTLKEGLESIGYGAFAQTPLKKLTLPKTVLSFDPYVCAGIDGTVTVEVPQMCRNLIAAGEFPIEEEYEYDDGDVKIVKTTVNVKYAGTAPAAFTAKFYMNDETDAIYATTNLYAGCYVGNFLEEIGNPTREGLIFTGWNTAADGSGEDLVPLTIASKGSATFYATWIENPYEMDGGNAEWTISDCGNLIHVEVPCGEVAEFSMPAVPAGMGTLTFEWRISAPKDAYSGYSTFSLVDAYGEYYYSPRYDEYYDEWYYDYVELSGWNTGWRTVTLDINPEWHDVWNTNMVFRWQYSNGFYNTGIGEVRNIKWTPRPITVTFDANGGEGEMEPLEVYAPYDDTALPSNTFVCAGSTLVGWNYSVVEEEGIWEDGEYIGVRVVTNEYCISSYDGDCWLYIDPYGMDKYNGNTVTLVAQWAKDAIITFDANGGEGEMDPLSLTCLNGYEGALPSNAFTRAGHEFIGWAYQMPEEKWQKDDNDEWVMLGIVTNQYQCADGDYIYSPIGADITLYAQWWKNTSVVTFDPGCEDYEGTMEPQTFATPYNGDWEEKPLTPNAFTRVGYTFVGWAYEYVEELWEDDGNGNNVFMGMVTNVYSLSGSEVLCGCTDYYGYPTDVTLVAQWAKDAIITFDANGGEGEMDPLSLTCLNGYEGALPSNAFTRAGHEFIGWAYQMPEEYNDGFGIVTVTNQYQCADGDYIYSPIGADATLYAQWWKNTSVVTFDPGCEDYEGTMEPQTFATPYNGDWEEKPLTPNAFTRVGYTFVGWRWYYSYIDDETGETVEAYAEWSDGSSVCGFNDWDGNPIDVTLVAQWSINHYTVTFDYNGGTDAEGNTESVFEDVEYDSELDVPVVTLEGYKFLRWESPDAEYTGRVPAGDVTYTAVWSQSTTVKFDANGGECAEEAREVYWGETVGDLPVPTRDNHVFDKWTTEDGSTATKEFICPEGVETVTLTAQWTFNGKIDVRTAVAEGDDALGKVTGAKDAVKTGAKVTLKATANKGAAFAGWFTNDVLAATTASYTYVAEGVEDIAFEARFVAMADDRLWISGENMSFSVKESVDLALEDCFEVESESALTSLSVSGLPTGLKYDAKKQSVSGAPTKPGLYYVTCAAKNGNGYQHSFTAVWNVGDTKSTDNDNGEIGEDDLAKLDDLATGIAYELDGFDNATAVSGLPSGLKFNKATGMIAGVPTKAGKAVVTLTGTNKEKSQRTVIVADSGMYALTLDVAAYSEGATNAAGKVTGGGVYAVGKSVTLKATPDRGCVFAGWYGADGEPFEGSVDYRATSLPYVTVDDYVTLTAKFATVDDDSALTIDVDDAYETDKDGSFSLVIPVTSVSAPTLKVTGLPAGLKFDAKALAISGTATKPDTYTVKATATNASIKKGGAEATFTIKVPNLLPPAFDEVGLEDSYKCVAGAAPELSELLSELTTNGWKLALSGLPSGLKFDAKNSKITGVATKEGSSTVYFTATRGSGASAEKQIATATFVVEYPTLTLEMAAYNDSSATNKASVAGAGKYQVGKKVNLKATADTKKNVFMGWYDGETLVSKAASYSYETTDSDVTLTAMFATLDEDKAIALALNGAELCDCGAITTNLFCGVAVNWPVDVDTLSAATVKVSGLPSGMKFTDKGVLKKGSKTEFDILPNTIYGVPTAASKPDNKGNMKPSNVKITVTTAGKATRTYMVDVVVDPLPDWAFGTFDGEFMDLNSGEVYGLMQGATISSSGKISGKLLDVDGTWTLTADSFDASYDGEMYVATVIGKNGKLAFTNVLSVVSRKFKESVRGVVVMYGESASLVGVQNLWKSDSWKKIAQPFANKKLLITLGTNDIVQGTIELKFAASGAVTASGKFITGYTNTNKAILYSASCSSVLIPSEKDDNVYGVGLYFQPNKGKNFPDGYAAILTVEWDAESKSFKQSTADDASGNDE